MKLSHLITPHLWFATQAKEAAEFYVSVFPNSRIISTQTLQGTPSGAVELVAFELNGQRFEAISAGPYFTFSEAVSFIIKCDTNEELDYYWEKLSAVPESEQCGWCKDKFGLSWQIVPSTMDEMILTKDKEALNRVTQSLLQMKKIDADEIQKAYNGVIDYKI
jgi:predicted 3-demethylubiquinone-9 3-methyltransferase (glyoxalase superfamily)